MGTITISFSHPINISVQEGDMAYYANVSHSQPMMGPSISGSHNHSAYADIIQIGLIDTIDRTTNTITCAWNPNPAGAPLPTADKFIMFSKDNKANLSSLLGYFATVEFRNNSTNKAELFSVGTDIFESSK